ncbi:ATP-binding cassette domain-containing protein [Paenibacillus alginolyticus]|uniref:ATP-binding cassette domain-containing protein n=1 Tax=Paenibacillus alginolyticus TaxID=59839 RepID=A0ABT4GQH6_9BACL|nr:ATP-binding cassette domain-containing protein [Paenibacillus alginolyticus]MCY9667285.1 ATP-binding cassette domain-containing protein [Paenibacillus alginolyticus]MCY9698449.1 ATP-binding cassette domain-containing protein [Paenibacillus alginolyticus]MEC0142024.1 ATP-binding cassette domain-containing protein [Paenibacillus alginolyticus]
MIRVEQVVKTFGNKKALDSISFSAGEGRIVGLLGTNGAGKSTMLKAMAGLLRLDRGKITMDGKSPCLSTRGILTYLPDKDVWYPWMKLSDAMQYMKDIYWDWDDNKARHLLDFFELMPESSIREASKGTRAKMKLLLALSRQASQIFVPGRTFLGNRSFRETADCSSDCGGFCGGRSNHYPNYARVIRSYAICGRR